MGVAKALALAALVLGVGVAAGFLARLLWPARPLR